MVIADNVVSGTSETENFDQTAIGILVDVSALIEIRGNIIHDTKGATTNRGIELFSSPDVTVIDNLILNAAGTGTTGIYHGGSSIGLNCIDNTIAGFTTALSGCDFSAGNNLVP